jgi:hypothetical protein
MISDKQFQANRKNALRSTGPRTEAGKAISSKNAITHGLRSAQPVIDGEDPVEYNNFRNDMIAQFAPIGPMEHLLVDRIVHSAWRLRRIGRIEVEAFDFLQHPAEKKPTKIAASLLVERNEIAACHDLSPFGQHNRFSSFDEAKAAWFQTEDGVLYRQDKWPYDPDYPSPVESFSNFIKPPKQPEPLDNPEILSDAIDLVRSETDSKEDITMLDVAGRNANLYSTGRPAIDTRQGVR